MRTDLNKKTLGDVGTLHPIQSEKSIARYIYFVGIGGIGMSALARYFVASGACVAGYDKAPSKITDALVALGIDIHFEDATASIPKPYLNPEHTLVIYTPAIPECHSEWRYFKQKGYWMLKRSQVLGLITKNTFCLAVSGTHGKTTTTSILGHMLAVCNVPVTAFLGGISANYNTNLITNGNEVSIVEADEFDRSFLSLSPNIACITSMDADHLDCYGDALALEKAFEAFSKKIAPNGMLLVKEGLPIRGITCGFKEVSDYAIQNVRIQEGHYIFDVKTPKEPLYNLQFHLPGRHNLSNALMALAMALTYGCSSSKLADALASYKGVQRRFTYHIKTETRVLIDDYAHHPKEIDAVRQAITERHPHKKVLAIFQPHLYSRTRDFMDDFASSLSPFDEVLLLEIYPARERPIAGITSAKLLSKIRNKNKKCVSKKHLLPEIRKSNAPIVLVMGAGDIGEQVERIKKELSLAN